MANRKRPALSKSMILSQCRDLGHNTLVLRCSSWNWLTQAQRRNSSRPCENYIRNDDWQLKNPTTLKEFAEQVSQLGWWVIVIDRTDEAVGVCCPSCAPWFKNRRS